MSYKNFKKIIIIAISLITLSCHSGAQEKWSKEMEVSIYNGGGMDPSSTAVIITQSSGQYIHQRLSKADTLMFTLSTLELDELLKEINDSHFSGIISGETSTIAYDKPTTSVKLIRGTTTHEVSVGATEGIKKGNASDFYKLYNYILSLAEKKTAKINPN